MAKLVHECSSTPSKNYMGSQSVVSDQDVTFTNAFWRELLCLSGTRVSFNSTYNPQLEVFKRIIEI